MTSKQVSHQISLNHIKWHYGDIIQGAVEIKPAITPERAAWLARAAIHDLDLFACRPGVDGQSTLLGFRIDQQLPSNVQAVADAVVGYFTTVMERLDA